MARTAQLFCAVLVLVAVLGQWAGRAHGGGGTLRPMGTNARRPLVSEDRLSLAILNDPSRDPFDLLTAEELADWAHLDPPEHAPGAPVSYTLRPPTGASTGGSTLDEILRRLEVFEDVLYINVRLVGFDGDGEQNLRISPVRALSPPCPPL